MAKPYFTPQSGISQIPKGFISLKKALALSKCFFLVRVTRFELAAGSGAYAALAASAIIILQEAASSLLKKQKRRVL